MLRSSIPITSGRRRGQPANAFKPFGSGQRACIGRQFAMQEAVLVLGMILQRFELLDQQNYQLKIKESLTIKPDGLLIGLRLRPGRTTGATPRAAGTAPSVASTPSRRPAYPPMWTGTTHRSWCCSVPTWGRRRGSQLESLRTDQTAATPSPWAPWMITPASSRTRERWSWCASSNGKPPDNAERFCRWITDSATASDAGSGLAFTVFGCGNMDWASTYKLSRH